VSTFAGQAGAGGSGSGGLERWAIGRLALGRYPDLWFLGAMTVAMVAIFWLTSPTWLNPRTIPAIVAQNAPLALVAMAMTFSIISRHIDLSTGSVLALAGVVCGVVYRDTGSLLLALPAAFVVSVGVNVLNGLLVSRLGLSAIMVTLAAFIWARGLALALTKGAPIEVGGAWAEMASASVAGFTITAPIVVAAYLLGWLLLARTKMGRYTYAMGGDPAAARRARIDLPRYTLLIFVLMGLMVGLGSIIVVGQLASAQPYVAGGLVLDAIICVIIGGTRLQGGEGSLGRTALGVAFIAILNSGLLNLGLTDAYYQVYKGAILLAVLSVQIVLRRMAEDATRRRLEREAMGLTQAPA
jgi:ribose/xylose/arabinose/galactoside ABC-type transport system permease subunit